MVIICSEDREGFGYGHRSRALALFDIFDSLGIDFICLVTNLKWEQEIKKRNIKTLRLSVFSGDKSEAKDLLNKVSVYMGNLKLFFCDGNRFGTEYLDLINDFFEKTVLIDDLGYPVRDQVDFVWNPNIYASPLLYKNWHNIILYAGIEYVLMRKEFYQPILNIKRESIFISLSKNNSSTITSIIKNIANQYGLSVILSDNFSVNKMVKSIDNSILTICGASVTLHEVWRRNAIALPVCQAKDQIHFRQFLISNDINFVDILNKNEFKIENEFNNLFQSYFTRSSKQFNRKINLGDVSNSSNLFLESLLK